MRAWRSALLLASSAAAAALLLSGAFSGVGVAAPGASVSAGPTAGVVNVDTLLGYEQNAAAGTGIVLSPSGAVLTNNHVIRGATRLRVADPATGRTYSATVIGYSLSGDVALLKLAGASRVTTATLGNSARVGVGNHVTAVGNAGGRGGSPAVTTGTVTGLHRTITVRDDQGESVRLTDLIKTNAPLEPGDSGGPLLDGSGRVIGVDTAAESGFDFRGGGNGYAIPINRGLAIVKLIEAGRSSTVVHIGPTSFLGISVERAERAGGATAHGALVSGVLPASPADKAGLAAGDVITSLGGHAISSPIELVNTLLRTHPGETLRLRWTDRDGNSHGGTIRPVAGPPQ